MILLACIITLIIIDDYLPILFIPMNLLLDILLYKRLSSPNSFISLYQCELIDSYLYQWVIIIFIIVQNWPMRVLLARSFIILTCPNHSLSTLVHYGTIQCSMTFSAVAQKLPISSRSPGSFLWKIVCGNQGLSARCNSCYGSFATHCPSMWTERTKKYIYSHTCMHIHSFISIL